MNLEQFWNAFYDDSAPFFINKYNSSQGNELLGETKWMDPAIEEPEKEYLLEAWDYDTIAYRTFDTKIYLDGNPFADHCFSHVNMLLLQKTDTDITIK